MSVDRKLSQISPFLGHNSALFHNDEKYKHLILGCFVLVIKLVPVPNEILTVYLTHKSIIQVIVGLRDNKVTLSSWHLSGCCMRDSQYVGRLLSMVAAVAVLGAVAGLSMPGGRSQSANVLSAAPLLAVVSSSPTPTPTLTPIGFVSITNNFVYGWTCDPDNTATSVAILFKDEHGFQIGDGTVTLANLPTDPSVAANCGGNGNHGFKQYMPVALMPADGKSHSITVIAQDTNPPGNPVLVTLPGSPVVIATPGPLEVTAVSSPKGGDILKRGSTYPIKWNVAWPEAWALSADKLPLSTTIWLGQMDGSVKSLAKKTSIVGSNSFQWTVSSYLKPGQYFITVAISIPSSASMVGSGTGLFTLQ